MPLPLRAVRLSRRRAVRLPRRRALLLAALFAPFAAPARAQASFDHGHAAWTRLLAQHVQPNAAGNASRVDYKGFAAARSALQAYLQSLSAVPRPQYDGWSKPQQFAFLANAYNAFTVEKILTRYPDLRSIRDFGRVFGNPWKDPFFTLLGDKHHLDWIEHETLRAPGAFDEPRVHVAANCASIGCPMLGRSAFTADGPRRPARGADAGVPVRPQPQPLRRREQDAAAVADLRLVQGGLRARRQELPRLSERRRRSRQWRHGMPSSWPTPAPTVRPCAMAASA